MSFSYDNYHDLKNYIYKCFSDYKDGKVNNQKTNNKFLSSNIAIKIDEIISIIMGIVFNQSYKNIIIIAFALLIGGINTLYFYPVFLKEQYYGLVVFISYLKPSSTFDFFWKSTHHYKIF